MSTGNPDLTPLASQIKPEQKGEISPAWFYGTGDENRGIIAVNFSIKFHRIGAEKIKEVTGFSMEEFETERQKLQDQYVSKKDAPFEFDLHPDPHILRPRK